jgi:hypothetical protein
LFVICNNPFPPPPVLFNVFSLHCTGATGKERSWKWRSVGFFVERRCFGRAHV